MHYALIQYVLYTEVPKYKVGRNIINNNIVKKCAAVRRGDDNRNYHCPSGLTPIIIIMSIRPTFRLETQRHIVVVVFSLLRLFSHCAP